MTQIKYEEYCYLMNRIAYWLVSNNKSFKKRDLYGYFNSVTTRANVESQIKNNGTKYQYDPLIAEYVECAINDNGSSLTFLPSYVTGSNGVKYYKDCYVDMNRRVAAFEVRYGRSPTHVEVQNKSTASTTTTSNSANTTYSYFVKRFGSLTDFDSALAKIKGRGYSGYYNSKYDNITCIDRMANKKGINCTDSSQVMYKVAVALGYTVQFVHVKCSSGTGHIRLRLKHPKNTGGQWIYRDPASVLKGNSVTSNWCISGYKLVAYDPSWIFTDLN